MTYRKYFKSVLCATFLLLSAIVITSCAEDLTLNNDVNEGGIEASTKVQCFLKNLDNPKEYAVFEMLDTDLKTDIAFGLTKPANKIIDATVSIDEAAAQAYNAKHKTSFATIPSKFVNIEENGAVAVAPGDLQSDATTITITASSELIVGTTYLLPLSVKSNSTGEQIKSSRVSLIKNIGKTSDCNKPNGLKIFNCMEINDANPLNSLEYTLKGSGKYLIDVLILFSANINYNTETGRVYLNCNENVTELLEKRITYLKPLQDRGMKIVVSILGHHDIAGISSLADATAREFAAELKSFADAYNLDGFFFDDEYSTGGSAPGFISGGSAAAARLIYEVKRAMPDKMTIPYGWSTTRSLQTIIDGVKPGDFIDYAIADYGAGSPPSNYLGSVQKQMVPWSSEFSQSRFCGTSNLTRIRTEGYGGHMIFALNPCRKTNDNWSGQLNTLQNIAKYMYEDELVWTGNVYEKNSGTPISREEWKAKQ